MINIKTICKHADAMGGKVMSCGFSDGATGYFVSLERVVDGEAHMIPIKETAPLMAYLKRTGARWEYRGNYTGILIYTEAV